MGEIGFNVSLSESFAEMTRVLAESIRALSKLADELRRHFVCRTRLAGRRVVVMSRLPVRP